MRIADRQIYESSVFLIICGIVIIGLGTGLRLYHINYQSLWYDELHSVVPTNPQNSVASVIEYAKGDQPPAFFIYLHYFFKLFSYEAFYSRLASAFLGILAIPLFYFLGKEFDGRRTGLFAAMLVAVNYFHIYYSQESRFYTMAFIFSALSYFFMIRAYKHTRIIDFIMYVISTALLLYTHYFGMILFAAQCITYVVLVIFYRKDWKFIVAGVISALAIIASFIPWMPVVLSDLGIGTFWIKEPSAFFILDYFYNYFGKDIVVTIVFVLLTAFFLRNIRSKNGTDTDKKPLYAILILWVLATYLIPYLRSLTSTPILHIRYTIITLPAWIIIFSIGWNKINSTKWKYALAVCIALSSLINLFFVRKYYSKIQKQQFREVSWLVKKKNDLHYPIYSQFAWHYSFYFRDYPDKVKAAPPADDMIADKFWLLQAEFFSPAEKEEEVSKYGETYKVVEVHPYYKAGAVLLERKHK